MRLVLWLAGIFVHAYVVRQISLCACVLFLGRRSLRLRWCRSADFALRMRIVLWPLGVFVHACVVLQISPCSCVGRVTSSCVMLARLGVGLTFFAFFFHLGVVTVERAADGFRSYSDTGSGKRKRPEGGSRPMAAALL